MEHLYKINQIDDRGWYLCNVNGTHYLCKDGLLHFGVQPDGFWPTKQEAKEFLHEWLKKNKNKPSWKPGPSYAAIYPRLCEIVRPLGYALTLHGSMARDLDLVAIPWVEDAAEPEEVAQAIKDHIDGFTDWDMEPGKPLPHGRRGWLIWFKGAKGLPRGGGNCIDLSIMPKTEK